MKLYGVFAKKNFLTVFVIKNSIFLIWLCMKNLKQILQTQLVFYLFFDVKKEQGVSRFTMWKQSTLRCAASILTTLVFIKKKILSFMRLCHKPFFIIKRWKNNIVIFPRLIETLWCDTSRVEPWGSPVLIFRKEKCLIHSSTN